VSDHLPNVGHVRPPRPGENPVDWMYSTGQLSESIYNIIRPSGSARVEASSAPPPVAMPAPSRVRGPAYARNPLVDDVLETSRRVYACALSTGEPPTLFPGGDIPASTRSGLDPQLLLDAPWTARHAIAAAATRAEAAELLDLVSGPDGPENARAFALDRHEGSRDYKMRVESWYRAGIDVESAQHARAYEAQVMASGGTSMTVDDQVEAMLAAGEQRAADAKAAEYQAILDGRAIGHFCDVNQVRASMRSGGTA
jgi:hypothetical protein